MTEVENLADRRGRGWTVLEAEAVMAAEGRLEDESAEAGGLMDPRPRARVVRSACAGLVVVVVGLATED